MNTALLIDARYNEGHYQTHCDYTHTDSIYDWDNVVQKYERGTCDLHGKYRATPSAGLWDCNADLTSTTTTCPAVPTFSCPYTNYGNDRRGTQSIDTPKNFKPSQDPGDRITSTGWRNDICVLPKLNCRYYIGHSFP